MRIRSGHICIFLVLFAFLISSCNRAKVIPKRKLVDVYVDLYLADQWLRDNNRERRKADTTLFFDPILREHGYTFEDYDKSLNYYAANPDKLADVLLEATEKLRKMADDMEELLNSETVFKPVYYEKQDFDSDSLWLFDEFIFWPVVDSLHLSDSLHVLDSIHVVDSLPVLDSIEEEFAPAEPPVIRPHVIKPSARMDTAVLELPKTEMRQVIKK